MAYTSFLKLCTIAECFLKFACMHTAAASCTVTNLPASFHFFCSSLRELRRNDHRKRAWLSNEMSVKGMRMFLRTNGLAEEGSCGV